MSRFKRIRLAEPTGYNEDRSKLWFKDVVTDSEFWFGIYIEDRDYVIKDKIIFVNKRMKIFITEDEDDLPEWFTHVGYRRAAFGETTLIKLYRAIVPYKEWVLHDRDKIMTDMLDQIQEHFAPITVCISGYPLEFYRPTVFQRIIEGVKLPSYVERDLAKLRLTPPKKYVHIKCWK